MPSGAVGNSSGTWHLRREAGEGPPDGWEALVREHRERLRRMVSLRLDARLRGRVDPSDVVRQVCAEARGRHPDYLRGPTEPFFLWLRRLAAEKLQSLRRQLGPPLSDGKELCLRRGPLPAANSQALAAQLLGQAPQPSQADARARRQARLEEALNTMDVPLREVLALRHFERLSAAEAAAVLELPEAEAGRLYLRALKALKVVFEDTPGPTRREGP
jgi:RNA polymerase sigma-70 factor, ECF subfamily